MDGRSRQSGRTDGWMDGRGRPIIAGSRCRPHLCDLPHPVWVILGRGAAAQHASGSVAVGNGREVAETTVRWTRKARDRNGLPVAD
eukprot:16166-Chlamydomonas_euryale.AAC.2